MTEAASQPKRSLLPLLLSCAPLVASWMVLALWWMTTIDREMAMTRFNTYTLASAIGASAVLASVGLALFSRGRRFGLALVGVAVPLSWAVALLLMKLDQMRVVEAIGFVEAVERPRLWAGGLSESLVAVKVGARASGLLALVAAAALVLISSSRQGGRDPDAPAWFAALLSLALGGVAAAQMAAHHWDAGSFIAALHPESPHRLELFSEALSAAQTYGWAVSACFALSLCAVVGGLAASLRPNRFRGAAVAMLVVGLLGTGLLGTHVRSAEELERALLAASEGRLDLGGLAAAGE